jgi:hypothetical protein
LASLGNTAHDAVVPQTFVDDAQLVWTRIASGRTQEHVAQIVGWTREKVKNYAALKNLCPDAWAIVGTSFHDSVPQPKEESVPDNGTPVPSPFNEYILRDIVALTPAQQVELVKLLLKDPKDKASYRKRAEDSRAALWSSAIASL